MRTVTFNGIRFQSDLIKSDPWVYVSSSLLTGDTFGTRPLPSFHPQHGDALGQAVQQQQTMPPWSFQQLCAAAATHPGAHGRKCDPASGNSGISTPSNVSALLSKLSGDDLELLAQHLVRTKHAVKDTDGDVLKVLARGGAGSSAGRGAGTAGSISEMDKDLLRLRCTGKNI